MSEVNPDSLFERVGGEAAVLKVLTAFYDRVLADEDLKHFFEGRPFEKLKRMQHEFFCAALGGPVKYSGRTLSDVHAGMGVTPRHLSIFLDHLLATMRDLGLEEDDIYDIYSRVNTYADEITGATNVDG